MDTKGDIRLVIMPRRDDRLALPSLGEWYDDLLALDAWINNRSKPQQAHSLLCSKLQERETRINERIEYLAVKRGLPPQEMRMQILAGKAQRMTVEDFVDNEGNEENNHEAS